MEKRIPFQIKMPPENYEKMKSEADRLGLTMSSFVNMLIFTYNTTVIHTTSNTNPLTNE